MDRDSISAFRRELGRHGFKETEHPNHGVYSFERNYSLTTGQYCEMYECNNSAYLWVVGEHVTNRFYPAGMYCSDIDELNRLMKKVKEASNG